jgi:hypothetical protein
MTESRSECSESEHTSTYDFTESGHLLEVSIQVVDRRSGRPPRNDNGEADELKTVEYGELRALQ